MQRQWVMTALHVKTIAHRATAIAHKANALHANSTAVDRVHLVIATLMHHAVTMTISSLAPMPTWEPKVV